MPPSQDITKNQSWVEENVDRLLAFELLKKACIADPSPIPNDLLADKIGVHKNSGFYMMSQIAKRYET